MTRAERAKIFAPFDAMKGLQEALRDREERHLRVERHEISEEQAEQNSRTPFMMSLNAAKSRISIVRSVGSN